MCDCMSVCLTVSKCVQMLYAHKQVDIALSGVGHVSYYSFIILHYRYILLYYIIYYILYIIIVMV